MKEIRKYENTKIYKHTSMRVSVLRDGVLNSTGENNKPLK
jgi:hypothetical protein